MISRGALSQAESLNALAKWLSSRIANPLDAYMLNDSRNMLMTPTAIATATAIVMSSKTGNINNA